MSTDMLHRGRAKRITRGLSIAILLGLVPSTVHAATSGANGTHDPSRMIESDGRFYVYSTGGGSKSSPDGLVWTSGPGLFPNGIPSAATALVANNKGVWAPDVIYLNGQYFIFYSIANGDTAQGVLTTPTLNPNSPNYKLTDRGVVLSSKKSDTYSVIDPAPVLDADGNLWVAWGSGYSKGTNDQTIYVTRLDNTTGLPSSADSAKPGHPLQQGHIEGSYIQYHSGYYYLFWNSGGCCDGASSTYLIHVARSTSITGPYSGNRNFYGSTGSIHGPGHMGIYDKCGASRFTYHYYPDTGGSVLGENELTWGADGWPAVGAVSTTPLKPCGESASTGGGSTGTAGTSGGGMTATGGRGQGGMAGGASGGAPTQTGGATGGGISGGGTGGVSGSGGSAILATGGAPSTSSGGSGTGGTIATGSGGMPAATGGASGVSDPNSGAGCSCAVGGGDQNVLASLLLLAGAAIVGARRRHDRRARRS